MIRYKKTVALQGLQPQMLIVMVQVADFSRLHRGMDVWVTSALDGKHSATSLHYAGAALDLDIPGPPAPNAALASHLEKTLPQGFDVIHEETHVHVEWQPRFR